MVFPQPRSAKVRSNILQFVSKKLIGNADKLACRTVTQGAGSVKVTSAAFRVRGLCQC
jgi:hypothetical protein